MSGKKRGKRGKILSGPEVFGEEVSSGSKPIEGVGTAVAAFVGFVQRSPLRAAATLAVVAMVVAAVRSRSRDQ